MRGNYGEKFASRGRVRGNYGEMFASRGREDKIKHVLIFLDSRDKFLTVCGHRENRAELGLIKHPIKIHRYSRDSCGSRWCRRKKSRRHRSHVRMPCIFIGCLIDQAQLYSHDGRTGTMRNLPRKAKNMKHV